MLRPMTIPHYRTPSAVPPGAGLGVKPRQAPTLLRDPAGPAFLEIEADESWGDGGTPHVWLTALRERFALSLNDTRLTIGGAAPLDQAHLARLQQLIARYQPGLFSAHLATPAVDAPALTRVVRQVEQMQRMLGTRMLLRRPFPGPEAATMAADETAFLAEIVAETGCGLVLDIGISRDATAAERFDARTRLDAFPMAAVGQIRLSGLGGNTLGRQAVWALYGQAVRRAGPVPTLIAGDDATAFTTLAGEARRAESVIAGAWRPALRRAA